MWRDDKEAADGYLSAISHVVKGLAGRILTVEVVAASPDEDALRAGDYVIQATTGTVACRIRYTDNCPWREWTIRSTRPSGAKTELAKLKEGYARWYLYAWVRRDNYSKLEEWIWIDLDIARASGVLDKHRREIPNPDGSSYFVAIPLSELEDARAVIAGVVKEPA